MYAPTAGVAAALLLLLALACSREGRSSAAPTSADSALLAAVHAAGIADEPGLKFSASVEPLDDSSTTMDVVLTARNTTTRPERFSWGACGALVLQAYRGADRGGPPAWQSENLRQSAPGEEPATRLTCPDVTYARVLLPGDSARLYFRFWASQILGDSLPSGRYHFTALFRMAADTVALPAGTLDLSR